MSAGEFIITDTEVVVFAAPNGVARFIDGEGKTFEVCWRHDFHMGDTIRAINLDRSWNDT